MAATFGPVEFLIVIVALPLLCHGLPGTLTLERAFPVGPQANLSLLVHRDRVRHSRMLQSSLSSGGVVNFRLQGSLGLGIYSTRIQLGSPPRDFYVQVDTGSDILWVGCTCQGCPSSGFVNSPRSYDPRSSSTVNAVSCTDPRCQSGCSAKDNLCSYTIQYADGSSAAGYYVSDTLHFETTLGNSETASATAPIVFGCSTQVVDTTRSFLLVDGIFGLGQNGHSVISQLASQRIAPRAFSHCLRGDGDGGGLLVLAALVEPNMVYTPIVPSQLHYNVNLRSIYVNGQLVPVNPSIFATSNNRGTIIDSGTTLAYLADEAYDPFLLAITTAVPQAGQPFLLEDGPCYSTSSGVRLDIFPEVRFDFEGGASLLLGPRDYLADKISTDGVPALCLGFRKNQGLGLTILGDLVLKNKIFVYDLTSQRIGWVNYNCSTPINVYSTIDTANSGHDNATGPPRHNISVRVTLPWTIMSWIMVISLLLVGPDLKI